MASPVEKFVEEPSNVLLNALTKEQLIELASHYNIELNK